VTGDTEKAKGCILVQNSDRWVAALVSGRGRRAKGRVPIRGRRKARFGNL